MTAIEKAIAALEVLFEYTDNEATQHPWWGITRQSKIGVIGEVLLAGPFFSRESATNALEAQRYHFGKHARVYCFSASRANDYTRLVNCAREALSELRAERASALGELVKDEVRSQGEKVEGLEEAIILADKFGGSNVHPLKQLIEAAKLQLERQRG